MVAGKGAARAAKGDASLVQGVRVELVKIDLVNAALGEAGIDSGKMSATEKVEALQLHNRKQKDNVLCGACGGIGLVKDPACPFCGDEGEEEEDDEEAEAGEEDEMKTTAKKSKAAKPAPQNALRAVKAADVVPEFSEKALDEVNAKILEVKERAKHDYWEIGTALLEVYSQGLWKARMKGNKVAYTGFNQYVIKELGIVPTTAFNMMNVAKAFPEAKIRQIGGAKLMLLLKAPEAERKGIMDKIEKGASARDVEREVQKAKKKHKVERIDRGRKKMPKGKPGSKKRADGRITIAMVESTKTYELWAKPSKPLKPGEKPTKRAKSLKDEPWAQIKLANGVEQLIELSGSSSGLKVKITTRRR